MKATEIFDVTDKVVLITGGANGIGAALARALADNGARVTLLDVDLAAAEETARALVAAGGHVTVEVADLTDFAQVQAAIDRVVAREGHLDAVFANAGIPAGPGFLSAGERSEQGAIENIPFDLWKKVLDINLHGVFRTVKAAVPHLKNNGGGRIVVTTSTAATRTSVAVGTPYLATKAASAHLVRQLAMELAPFNILVNAIQPGPFRTRITTPELAEIFKSNSPMHKVGELEEIEGLALFFVSNASSFVTGAQYTVDGGNLLGRAD
ncbi:SDR family NAD(P)-dependent oxidoreductase [Rhizobium rhizogenes]|uniref:SDR family NAD(P)-dependent oxidoreductase n=1 Tax=Rhizobium rhizogenes TaxID=359 RepID=UPI001574792B|nr:SDR family NAD(P)-dependent oxidoreductase [Rhizobium rhizogenes]NTI78538.1 SDR family oxidoreductase [Rhizobium rhizogenes]